MSVFDDARTSLGVAVTPEKTPMLNKVKEFGGEVKNVFKEASGTILGRDYQFDYSGVPRFGFRAGLSRADTAEERKMYLDQSLGPDGWTQDKYGNYAITPKGAQVLELPKTARPTVIDEKGLSRYDVADLMGDSPAIAGAMTGGAAGMLAGGIGAIPGAMIGGMLGKSMGEGQEALMGQNLQPPDRGGTMAKEGLYAAGGEYAAKGLQAVGRKILGPFANRMTPEARQIVAEAKEMGVTPSVQQTLGSQSAPLVSRAQSVINKIIGDPLLVQNERALTKHLDVLREIGPSVGRTKAGQMVEGAIKGSRQAVRDWSKKAYGYIDEMTQGPVVPTARIKGMANEISENAVRTAEGKPLSDLGQLKNILDLPDNITMGQLRELRGLLRDAMDQPDLFPGLSQRRLGQLYSTTHRMMDDTAEAVGDDTLKQVIKSVNGKYRAKMDDFDLAEIKAITKHKGLSGAVVPERVVRRLFRKGESTNLQSVMKHLNPEVRDVVKREAMEDILNEAVKRTDDPLKDIFTGKNYLNTLDAYGKETLHTMFGRHTTDQLYRFGRVASLSTLQMSQAGGIVAANIALHPWRNFGRLVGMGVMSKVMNSRNGIKWLTEGLEAPTTRAVGGVTSRLASQVSALTDESLQE